jgi:hypothetical protein
MKSENKHEHALFYGRFVCVTKASQIDRLVLIRIWQQNVHMGTITLHKKQHLEKMSFHGMALVHLIFLLSGFYIDMDCG